MKPPRLINPRPRLLLLLDFDGTLSETTDRPEEAKLSARRRRLLIRLNSGERQVALVSGRSLVQLKQMVPPIPGVVYAGNFGMEIDAEDWDWRHPGLDASVVPIRELAEKLVRRLEGIPGTFLETKGTGLAVHHRAMPKRFRRTLRRRLAPLFARAKYSGLVWHLGDRAWEVMPALGWAKREACMMLWKRFGRPRLLAIGNDESDEGMFEAARGRGASFRVGPRKRSNADGLLLDVNAVWRLLESVLMAGTETPRPRPRAPRNRI
jgi:trehalose-phosphatase